MWEWPREKFKEVKNLRWLSWENFKASQLGQRPNLEEVPDVDIRHHVRMRNSISRDTNTTSGEGGELFPVSYSDLSLPDASLTLYARVAWAGLDILTEALEMLGRPGYMLCVGWRSRRRRICVSFGFSALRRRPDSSDH